MKEIFEQTTVLWKDYWGASMFPWLLCVAILYLLIFKRKDRYTKYILSYLGLALFVFFCPLTARIIQKCIGKRVYWRVLWIVPSVPVLAYSMTELLKKRRGIAQFICVVICAGVIIVSGKEFYAEGYYKAVHNYQQVPDEVAGVCELVKADASDRKYKLAADNYISPYVRVYDPSIEMLFGRECRGNGSKRAKNVYYEINSPAIDYGNLGKAGSVAQCDYLVAPVANDDQKAQLSEWKYQEIGVIGRYGVYKLEK